MFAFHRAQIVASLLVLGGCGGGSPFPTTLRAPGEPIVQTSVRVASSKEAVLVINDSSPTSTSLGGQYEKLRHVSNIVHVACADSALNQVNETISFANFANEIGAPIRTFLRHHSEINFIVLTKGIPIRVSGGHTGEAYSGTAEASLDSTIAAFGYDQIPGAVKVRFKDPAGFAVGTAWLNRFWNAKVRFSHAMFGGYIVTRLDGYTLADALALTERAIRAPSYVGKGDVLLDIEPDFGLGSPKSQPAPIVRRVITKEAPFDTFNADMEHAGDDLAARGIPVDAAVTTTFVGRRRNLLGYFSWGSNDDHFSQRAYNGLRFAPGAVGDTAVSTSARSFFPQTYGQSMIADLISQGITGIKGYTDEPLLQAVSSPTIVLARYTRGYTLGESFYAGSHFVGWTDIVVGDPLAQPYAQPADVPRR